MFVSIRYSLHSVRFGQLLRRAHKCIVNIMKVYIEMNNIQVELTRFRKNSDFIAVGNFEVGIYFRDRSTHCYPRRVATVLFSGAGRTGRFGTSPLRYTPFRDIFNSVHSHFGTCPIRNIATSGHFHIGTSTIRDCTTALFQVTMYRQFARKVVLSANPALSLYYSPRL